MSFDIRDFVSLACLTNTPFPNNFAVAATGIDKEDISANTAVNLMFEHKNYRVVTDRMRLFVCWGVGDLDKDLGLYIQNWMWSWFEKHGEHDAVHGVDSGSVEAMRHAIYGPCKNAGRDYFDYQPCPPDTSRWFKITTIEDFKKHFDNYSTMPKGWQNRWVAARIRLADEWAKGKKDAFRRKRWPYLVWAFAVDLNLNAGLLAAGLKGEF